MVPLCFYDGRIEKGYSGFLRRGWSQDSAFKRSAPPEKATSRILTVGNQLCWFTVNWNSCRLAQVS